MLDMVKKYVKIKYMKRPKVGKYRLIPKGTVVWSIGLQLNIQLVTDEVVKITNTVYCHDDYFYGTLQLVLFNCPGMIPGVLDKHNGDVGLLHSNTRPWKLPKPQFLDFKYNK